MQLDAGVAGDRDQTTEIRLTIGVPSFAAADPGGWEHLFGAAGDLDRAGVDRLAVSDHVVMGEHLEQYGRPEVGGTAGGRQPTGPDGLWLEPLTVLTYLAAQTRTIRLSTNILLAGLRRPAALAKSVATLDLLSGGRVDLGVGVGWQREEYAASGLSFERRGRLLDETLEVCRRLWTEPVVSYTFDGVEARNIHMQPKPVQPGGVPVWVSGTVNGATARRLARFGHGWLPWGADAANLAESAPRMRDAVIAAGGDPGFRVAGQAAAPITVDGLDTGALAAQIAASVAAGATDVSVYVRLPVEPTERVDLIRAIVATFRATVGRPAHHG